jgi:hypothetical protein
MEIVTLHLIALIVTAPMILYADHMGFRYFTGRASVLPERSVAWTHRLVFIGLFLLIVTGVMLTVPSWEAWFAKPAFYVKLGFVLTLLINGLFIQKLMTTAAHTPYALLPLSDKRTLITSGALSGIGWIASILIGFFFL